MCRDGFGDGEVPVYADASQQEHTTEKCDLVDGVHRLAQKLPKWPLGHDTGGPEGQRECEEQVSHSQVQQEDIRHRLNPLEMDVGQDDQEVSQESQEADDAVDCGKEPCSEVSIGVFPTHHLKFIIIRRVILFSCFSCELGSQIGPTCLNKKNKNKQQKAT